jgi:hypothetical protein
MAASAMPVTTIESINPVGFLKSYFMQAYSFPIVFPKARLQITPLLEVSGKQLKAGKLESLEAWRLNRFELFSLIAFQPPGKMR